MSEPVPDTLTGADVSASTAASSPPPATLPAGFADLYEAHSRPVYYLALRLLGDPTQAEDAAHDIFIKAFRKMGEFQGRAEIRTWLYRIAINHCCNLRQTWAARNIRTAPDDSIFERVASPAGNPLRVLETRELGERIQRALDALPGEYRLLLLLVADDELSYAQVGELTDQTTDAVRGKLHRARKAFTVAFAQSA
ncbi:MAG: RNA polymerase sigma factor [Verrucomicrobiae bacterium]|nr:RNA polymerase sigma factor [Verrucomicrobiae bacterium]